MNHNKYIDLLLEDYDLKFYGTVPEKKIDLFMDVKVTLYKDDELKKTPVKKTIRVIYIPEDVIPSKTKKEDWKKPGIAFYDKDNPNDVLAAFWIKEQFMKGGTHVFLSSSKENLSGEIKGKTFDKIKSWADGLASRGVWSGYKQQSMF